MEKKIKSQLIYEGKIINVYKDDVMCPNDVPAYREVVRHHGGVGILAIENDCIILVQQFRYPYNQNTIEIPAGKLEPGEDSLEAGKRELEEETGYRCQEMTLINAMYPTPGYCDEIIHLYLAKNIQHVEDSLECDEDEFIDVIKMPIDDAYQKVLNQDIKDAKTVIAIMYAYIQKHQIENIQ